MKAKKVITQMQDHMKWISETVSKKQDVDFNNLQ